VPNYHGIVLAGVSNSVIGGTESGAGNLISGNTQTGIHIGSGSKLNSVLGNTIGTDVTGVVALPNAAWGIFIGFGASNNTIGGSDPGAGNLISGSGSAGVHVQDEESVGNQILGNRIGTNRAGTSALPNGTGVVVVLARETVIGGADTITPWVCDGPCNLISGNGGFGVTIQGVSAGATGQASPGRIDRLAVADQANQVLGNFVGTNLTGTSALPNLAGVDLSYQAAGNLVGGSSLLGEGNLIGGNQIDGIVMRHPSTGNNQISGNRIGTTADGEAALANGWNGVQINEGASSNTVGGEGAGLGNLISGHTTDPFNSGVLISSDTEPEAIDNQVIGNLIGTNSSGTSAIPNGGGVAVAYLVTGTIIRDNVISGNSLRGILIHEAAGNQVSDNDIGLAADGLSPLPNDVFGASSWAPLRTTHLDRAIPSPITRSASPSAIQNRWAIPSPRTAFSPTRSNRSISLRYRNLSRQRLPSSGGMELWCLAQPALDVRSRFLPTRVPSQPARPTWVQRQQQGTAPLAWRWVRDTATWRRRRPMPRARPLNAPESCLLVSTLTCICRWP